MVDGFLNGWVSELMNESLFYIGRWLKTMLKQVIVMVENANELIKKNSIEFWIYGH
jgi:hypothetical protein